MFFQVVTFIQKRNQRELSLGLSFIVSLAKKTTFFHSFLQKLIISNTVSSTVIGALAALFFTTRSVHL